MQQKGELKVSRSERSFEEPGFDGFISALSIAILSKGGDLETVWEVANRVYDRWKGDHWDQAAEWAQGRADGNLAMSA